LKLHFVFYEVCEDLQNKVYLKVVKLYILVEMVMTLSFEPEGVLMFYRVWEDLRIFETSS
jgi:hypothetical protein